MKKRILFVDDEPRVLDGLRRMLHSMAGEWDMVFVGSGEQALQLMGREPFDVLVTDMRMPRMSGAQLLSEVMKRWPGTIRFVLSGHSDQQMTLQTVTSAHQYLNKPCDPQQLVGAIDRACALRERLAPHRTAGNLAASLRTLPSLPEVYFKLASELQSPDTSLQRIGNIISGDIGMTAKILQMVNSAFFGLPQRITNPAQAVTLLGLETVKGLIVSVHVFSEFKNEKASGLSALALWSHSIGVSKFAKRIAESEKSDQRTISDSFTAGLLHDAGKLVLATALPKEYAQALESARKEGKSASEAETGVFGTTHAGIGAYLLTLWAFPDPVVEAVTFHHNPAESLAEGFQPLAAVHVANALEHRLSTGGTGRNDGINLAYIQRLGLEGRLSVWEEALQSMTQKGTEHECESALR